MCGMFRHNLRSQFNHRPPEVASSIQYLLYSQSGAAIGIECPGVMSSGRHSNSDGWKKKPRPPEKLRRPARVGLEAAAAVTRQGREQTLERRTPPSPICSSRSAFNPPPPAPSFILAVSCSIPRLGSERCSAQHSNESTAPLQSPEKGPH